LRAACGEAIQNLSLDPSPQERGEAPSPVERAGGEV